jgi:hypothetical protein
MDYRVSNVDACIITTTAAFKLFLIFLSIMSLWVVVVVVVVDGGGGGDDDDVFRENFGFTSITFYVTIVLNQIILIMGDNVILKFVYNLFFFLLSS